MTVELSVRDRIAFATLSRPQAQNGIDDSVLDGLEHALDAVEQDRSVRALVVTGAGTVFSVGLDLALLDRAFADLDVFADFVTRMGAVLRRLELLPVPVVAAVNGLARAGGLELVLACDLVVVAAEAKLADHHLASGVVPGAGASVRLPRRVGEQRARELLYTSRWLRGQEAVEWGLALRCVPRADLDSAVEELIAPLRRLSRDALAATKGQLAAVAGLRPDDALATELRAFVSYLREVPDSREGYLAYTQGRQPSWAT